MAAQHISLVSCQGRRAPFLVSEKANKKKQSIFQQFSIEIDLLMNLN